MVEYSGLPSVQVILGSRWAGNGPHVRRMLDGDSNEDESPRADNKAVVPVRRSQHPGRRKLPLRQLTGDLRAAVHELAGQSGAPWRPLIAEEVEPSAGWRYAHQAGREVHRPPPHPTATPNFIIAPALRLQLLHSHRLGRTRGCRPRPKSTPAADRRRWTRPGRSVAHYPSRLRLSTSPPKVAVGG